MKIFARISAVWFLFWFAFSFLLLYPIFSFFFYKEEWYSIGNKLRKKWAWFLMYISFIRVEIIRENESEIKTPCVFVSNHTSYIDIIAFGLFLPEKASFMAKAELTKIPLFGIFFRTVDIGVNRSSIKDAHKAFLEASDRIKKGYSIVIFPEGTIWKNAPIMKPFKSGAFKLAIDNKVPIQPVTFQSNYKILPDEKFEFYFRKMIFTIHRSVDTDNLKPEDDELLKTNIYSIIENNLKQNKIIS
ncbi:MAG: 1-acyl-sn-glycerol-3-phosphate acyltransferase [Bacteroidetes bacterium]|nr:1-acyl-sn-glycerol-3-phosphate acyltransferase [Bacteroidota bacterium]